MNASVIVRAVVTVCLSLWLRACESIRVCVCVCVCVWSRCAGS